jgi:hypothetical protein
MYFLQSCVAIANTSADRQASLFFNVTALTSRMQWRREVVYICISSLLVLHSRMHLRCSLGDEITMQTVLHVAFYCIILMDLHLRRPIEVGF